jgi:hypothetical protein
MDGDKEYHVIINGAARSGKDSFVEFCKEIPKSYNIYRISSVDRIYEAAGLLGWGGQKDEKGRQFLSDLKDMSTKNYDGPEQYMLGQIKTFVKPFVAFYMIREPEEIQKFKKQISNFCTLLINRPNLKQYLNHADANVEKYIYDYIIYNDGSLEELKKQAKSYLRYIQKLI